MNTDFEQLVGMSHAQVEQILSNKNIESADVRALEKLATRLVDEFEDEIWTLTEGDLKVPNEIDVLVRKQANAVDRLTRQLQDKEITLGTFNKKIHDTTAKNFEKAYKKGIGRALDAGDREWLRRATQTEVGFARNFAGAIESDALVMPRKARAQMYGSACRGAYWNGNVEKQDDEVLIFWRTTVARHCDDCLTLESQNPYSKFNLPTTPGAGATQCRGRCKCYLDYQTGAKTKKDRKAAEQGERKKEGLSLFTSFGPPPSGMRLPNMGERLHIDDLRSKINFNRRKMAQTGLSEEEMKNAIMARKAANADLIDFLEQGSIWERPIWSVDEVIDGRHIGLGAESEIFSAGIDSQTLDMLTPKQLNELLEKFGDDASEILKPITIRKADIKPGYKIPRNEVHPDQVDFKPTKKFIKDLSIRLQGGTSEYSLVANGLAGTFQLMKKVLAAAPGKKVTVGPLSLGDDMLSRVYVWIKGPTEDVEKVLKEIKGIEFVATPVMMARRK